MNRATKGIQTAKRFKIESSPEFILVRQGKFYRYNLKKYDIESLIGFATSWFKNVNSEKIKAPKSTFDKLIDTIVIKLKELPKHMELLMSIINDYPVVALSMFALFAILILLKLFKRKPQESKQDKQDSKKDQKKNVKKEK